MNTKEKAKTMRFHRTPRTLGVLLGTSAWLVSGLAQASNSDPPVSPTIPAESVDDSSLTVVWQKPVNYANVTGYKVYNGSTLLCTAGTGPTSKPNLYCHITGLAANTGYTLSVASEESGGESSKVSTNGVTTKAAMTTVLLSAHASQSGVQTSAIQSAINTYCVSGSRLKIQSGESFTSGALNLPNNCTFQIDGTLTASTNASDFQHTSDRFPLYGTGGNYGSVHYPANYNGLLNTCAGNAGCSASNVRLVGAGTVSGGQYSSGAITVLATNEVSAQGGTDSARGDLLNLNGVSGLYIRGLTFNNPAEHVIFVSRSSNVTVETISSNSYQGSDSTLHNGDGIDLATSTHTNIFGSSFNTGDDCINLNAGSNLPGQTENRPDGASGSFGADIHIFDNTTNHGHGGVVFGSFTAAWIQDVMAEDNYFNGTDVGYRFKTGTNRGGGARYITARDTKVSNIGTAIIQMTGTYADSSGMSSAGAGSFNNIKISGITGTGKSGAYAVSIDGNTSLKDTAFTFTNVNVTGAGKGISVYQLNSSTFTNVTNNAGSFYYDKTESGLSFSGCSPTPTAK